MSKTMHSKTKQTRKTKVLKIRLINIIAIVIIVVMALDLITKLKTKSSKIDPNFVVTPEILRSREYDVVNTGEEATDSEYVKFDAFFLKDLDGDGEADSIRGTCNEIGKEDTLYMDLKVINNGYLKDGVITINSSNFYLSTSIVKDSSIAQNYISNNTKTIKLNNMTNGMQKLLTGIVRSGDYSNGLSKTSAIGNDTRKYSKVNSIVFTGTHVTDSGTETKINKTINFNVDWYGRVSSEITIRNVHNTVNNMDELIENEQMKLNFNIQVAEKNNELILKSNYLEGKIPELNGYKPINVQINSKNIEYTYNEETGEFSVKKDAVINENGEVTEIVNTTQGNNTRYNDYEFEVIYPKEAYDAIENDDVTLLIPVKTWYEGYNNPSEQFTNPYISNISQTTISARWEKYQGYAYRFKIQLGEYSSNPYPRYVISKEKPLKIYNHISEQEKEDYYTVKWMLFTGNIGTTNSVIMKETANGEEQVSDKFIKTDSNKDSMENLSQNIGIYFTGQDGMLGENGWIKVIDDETNMPIVTFTKADWNQYTASNPYKYENPVKHIRIETSGASVNSSLTVYNVKELDDEYITTNYTKENFDKLQYIESNLTGYFDEESSTVTNNAYYEAPISLATISMRNNKFSTQEKAENQEITINTKTSDFNLQKWKNGIFLVKFPSEILQMEINKITLSNSNVQIIGYDLYEENGNYYLKILTENEKETSYSIKINCNITPDPRTETVNRDIELYAKNEIASTYSKYDNSEDIYDIDEDSNTTEIINKNAVNISLISPNELLTHQIATNYDKENNITVAPRVAKTDKEQRTADIEVSVSNNYSQDITDVVVQGVIPFEGNKYIIGNGDLGSKYSTWMSDTGIQVPTTLKNIVTVYYSTEETPTNDIEDSNNKWQLAENVADWSKIKTYIIDFGNYQMTHGETYTFKYQINIPEGLKYNDVSYSEHGIYFSLITDQGKYRTLTAASKLGFMIAKQYDLEITKYQEDTEKLLPRVTFSVEEEGTEESKVKSTNSNGEAKITGLYAERTYILKEIKTINDYVLNEEEIKLYTYTDENDKLYVTYKNDDGTYSDLAEKYTWMKTAESTKEENEDYKVKIALENEVKPRLKIIKVENQANERLSAVSFNIKGKEIEKSLYTDVNGELTISGLYLNEEYEITENRKQGYYGLEPIKFKITKNNQTYSAQILEGVVKQQTINTIDSIPQLELTLENEKIPTYNLQITKVEEKHEEKTLANAEYILKSEDDNSQKRLITNENGTASIGDLYQFTNGKAITGKYTLKETKAPNGYVNNQEEISFIVSKNGDNLEINVENESNLTSFKSAEVEGNTVKITLQDKPLFKLTKTDQDTGEPLSNTKFIIYEIDDVGNEIDFAKDVNGNYVGELNEKNQYIIETDENGEKTIPLRNGTYRSIEIEAPIGYERNPDEKIFKITGNEEEQEIGTPDVYDDTLEINYIEDLVDFAENVRNGDTYSGTKVILKRTLDFADSNSYKDAANTTAYGDYNLDGNIDTIKTELTTGLGFIGSDDKPFSGIFDGGGYEINGIHIDYRASAPANIGDNKRDLSYPSLFKNVKNGKIKNLGIDGMIKGFDQTAGFIGNGENVEVYNCYNNCNLIGSGQSGSIVGLGETSVIIENCYNNGNIQFSGSYCGGLLGAIYGTAENVIVKSSYNNANLNLNSDAGGLLGLIRGNNVLVENCYNYGNIINQSRYCAGIGGIISGTESAIVTGCINYGNIANCNGYIAGIIESANNKTKIYNCINYGNIGIGSSEKGEATAGICADMRDNDVEIQKCINYGNIESNSAYVGGISAYSSGTIKECGNYGTLKGTGNIGGITGTGDAIIENAFNKGDIYIDANFTKYSYASGIAASDSSLIRVKNSYTTRKNICCTSKQNNELCIHYYL